MFYIGQKVVFRLKKQRPGQENNQNLIIPKNGEVVTILRRSENIPTNWIIKEYRFMANGFEQSTHHKNLTPLLTDSVKYAEKLLEEITIEINEENLVTK